MKLKITVLLVLITLFAIPNTYARESFSELVIKKPPPKKTAPGPWFTGPLLAPSGHVVPKGHQNYEPYVYWTQVHSVYGKNWTPSSTPLFNNILLQNSVQVGVYDRTEFDFAFPQIVYNQTRKQELWRMSDVPITLAFQVLNDKEGEWYPAIKLRFAANIPLGKYDHLSPSHLGTDIGGIGTWYPGVGLVFGKMNQIKGIHYLSTRLFFSYNFGTPVKVKDLSVYGGAGPQLGVPGTRGTVYPGNVFVMINGYEFSLTQNWALALDIEYQHTDASRFSGYSPVGPRPRFRSQEFIALAPGIEYNWNENVGVIVGPEASVAGRNTPKLISYIGALNIYV